MSFDLDRPLMHADRAPARIRPVKALRHLRRLIANKEETEHVFHIVHALRRRGEVERLARFFESERGRALYRGEPDLPAFLDDHDRLRRFPHGSVAHAYCDFMEAEGLTAHGLLREYARFASEIPAHDDLFHWYENRVRDMHDLLHVLTGYGRDALGEQCVLAFNYGSVGNYGILFIAYAGLFEVRKYVPRGTPILAAVNEATRHGERAEPLTHQRIEALLPLPLDEARTRLGIAEPTAYRAAHRHIRRAGMDPYDLKQVGATATA